MTDEEYLERVAEIEEELQVALEESAMEHVNCVRDFRPMKDAWDFDLYYCDGVGRNVRQRKTVTITSEEIESDSYLKIAWGRLE